MFQNTTNLINNTVREGTSFEIFKQESSPKIEHIQYEKFISNDRRKDAFYWPFDFALVAN